jgi:hypothetical protein
MKYLVLILSLFIASAAFGHEGFKVRDRYTDEHGVPYGGQNPPVGAGNTGAHCLYSAWGCSGAGGSTDVRGRSFSNPYRFQPYGVGRGVVGIAPCGTTHQSSGGTVGVRNGNVAGNVYMGRSQTNCTPHGYSSQSSGVNVGVVNGRVSGGVTVHRSQTQ